MERLVTKERGMENREMPPLTTYEISRHLHVDLTTVINWCEQGKLHAYKTPGGHRRVLSESFLEFIQQYNMPVPTEFSEKLRGTLKILIVDDEQDIRRIIQRIIRKRIPQAEIYEAQDGFEAGKLALDTLPHLVILDLKLPGIDGFKVCADIRKDERFSETKILAVTGQDTQENKKGILEAGANDYLAKPFEIKVLADKIFTLLGLPEEEQK